VAYNTKLYKSTGSAWEELRVASEWGLIANKPTTFTPTAHNHDTLYLGINAKAKDSNQLNGQLASFYAKQTDLPVITYSSGTLTITTGS
jgi:hypothetical protein